MIGFDLIKIVKNYRYWLFLIVLLIINFFSLQGSLYGNSYFVEEYNEIYAEGISNKNENLEDWVKSSEVSEELSDATQQIINEYAENAEYSEYLDNVSENADNLLAFPEYNKGFAKRNILKTQEDFQRMGEIVVTPVASVPFTFLSDSNTTDILIMVLLVIMVVNLVSKDQDTGMDNIIRATKMGKYKLPLLKMVVLSIITTVITALFYLENFILIQHWYGFGDLNASIQSIYGFKECILQISTGQYLALFFIMKWAAHFVFTVFLLGIAMLVSGSVELYISIVVIVGAEKIFYMLIPETSKLILIKYINIFSFVNSRDLLVKYQNLNFLGFPVHLFAGCILSMALLLAISLVMAVKGYRYINTHRLMDRLRTLHEALLKKKVMHQAYNLYQLEFKKMLITQKIWIPFLLFLLFIVFIYHPENRYYVSGDEAWYKQYMMYLEGDVNEEKKVYLESEEKYYNDLMEELAKSDNIVEKVVLQQKMQSYEGFQRVKAQYEYLTTVKNPAFFYDTGFKNLTLGDELTEDLFLLLLMFILCIGCFVRIHEIENATGMLPVVKTTRYGNQKAARVKNRECIILFSIAWVIAYGIRLFAILERYGLSGMGNDANCIQHLYYIPSGIPILAVLVLLHILYYLIGIFFLFVVLKISKWSAHAAYGIIVSTVIGGVMTICIYFIMMKVGSP